MTNPERAGKPLPSRREVLTLGIGAFIVAAVPFAGRQRRRRLVRRSVPVMGTIAEIAVVHRDDRYANAAIDAAIGEMREVERLLTRFVATSDVGRANAGAAVAPVRIEPTTAYVLEESLSWALASDGAFDPCLGGVVALWDVTNRHEPPAGTAIGRFAGRRLYRALELGTQGEQRVVLFHEETIGIDLGGIGKGHGVDRAVNTLRDWGITDALVNVGGDLYALGRSGEGEPWRVGVRSPADPQRLAGTLDLVDQAVATTGDYERYFDHGGERFHHLLDPATASPKRTSAHSVTIAAADCITADAAATAVFGMPQGQAERLLAVRAPGARIVHTG
jgi:FAD:protein FMN transferase